jgi:hypothetical protein
MLGKIGQKGKDERQGIFIELLFLQLKKVKQTILSLPHFY